MSIQLKETEQNQNYKNNKIYAATHQIQPILYNQKNMFLTTKLCDYHINLKIFINQ